VLVLHQRLVRVAVLSLAGFACLGLSGASADEGQSNPLGSGAEVVARGRELYNENCTVCHGVDGAVGDRAPALAAARSYVRRSDAELFDAVRNGIPGTGMPPTGLGDEDVWRVVAYVRSLRARAADFPTDGDRERGAALFWGQAECGRCHMVHGRGGLLGPDLTDLAARLSLRALREALTVPKPLPPKGYEPATITTIEGERIRGVLKNRHNFSYQLLSEDGRLHLLSAGEVARVEIADTSLMPADYDRRLSAAEFRDLLAYLTRLAR
jgi:putative heme-binding domain-containing protein